MSLLQDPIKALDQIDWYLENQHLEHFPGAFLIGAGNLSRQVLEQVLFILAFYGNVPQSKYMKVNYELKTAGSVLTALRQVNLVTGRTYLEEARRRGPRIRKFARYPRSFDKWRDELNEPSHFHNPATRRKTHLEHINAFSQRMRALFDNLDSYLITAAVNEILSKGKCRAVLANDEQNTPSVSVDLVVSPKDLMRTENGLSLISPNLPVRIVPNNEEVRLRWSKAVLLVQHSVGMMVQGRFVTEAGQPVDLSNIETMINSFTKTPADFKRLKRRLRQLGYDIRAEDARERRSGR